VVDATNTKTLGINAGNICEILPAINMKELKIPSIYKGKLCFPCVKDLGFLA